MAEKRVWVVEESSPARPVWEPVLVCLKKKDANAGLGKSREDAREFFAEQGLRYRVRKYVPESRE